MTRHSTEHKRPCEGLASGGHLAPQPEPETPQEPAQAEQSTNLGVRLAHAFPRLFFAWRWLRSRVLCEPAVVVHLAADGDEPAETLTYWPRFGGGCDVVHDDGGA